MSVNSNGGSILYAGTAALTANQQGTVNGGSAPARTLIARDYVFTATGAGSVGTTARPLQTRAPNAAATVGLTAGNGGIYLTDWNTPLNVTGATATGAGNIRIVTANVGGHNLNILGNVSTGSGNIYLASDDNLTVGAGVTIGGAGFSGTVWMQANRDRGTAGQTFTMSPTSAIVTSNTTNNNIPLTSLRTPTDQAVYLDISGDAGNPSTITAASITAGNGGRIVLNATPNVYLTTGAEAEAGVVVMAGAGNVLDVGPTGTSNSSAASNGGGQRRGTPATPSRWWRNRDLEQQFEHVRAEQPRQLPPDQVANTLASPADRAASPASTTAAARRLTPRPRT